MTQKKVPAVLGLAVRPDKTFLFTQRNSPESPDVHECWQIPGGGIEFGETPEQALAREFQEELQCSFEFLSPLTLTKTHVFRYPEREFHIQLTSFLVSIGEQEPDVSNDPETGDWRWYSLEEAADLKVLPQTLDFVTEWFEYIERYKIVI